MVKKIDWCPCKEWGKCGCGKWILRGEDNCPLCKLCNSCCECVESLNIDLFFGDIYHNEFDDDINDDHFSEVTNDKILEKYEELKELKRLVLTKRLDSFAKGVKCSICDTNDRMDEEIEVLTCSNCLENDGCFFHNRIFDGEEVVTDNPY
jgi:hypothetical protein